MSSRLLEPLLCPSWHECLVRAFLLNFASFELSSGFPLAQEPQRVPLSELDRLDRETAIRAVVERNPTIGVAAPFVRNPTLRPLPVLAVVGLDHV